MPVLNLSRILDIPERYRPGLAALINLSSASFDELQSALQRAPECASRKELSSWVTPEAKSISAGDVSRIVDSLTSLYRVRLRMEVSAERLAGDVVTTMRESGQPELRIDDDKTGMVTERLAKLLAIESLNVVETKAQELKAEFEHTFCDSRIFTDLRPVFGGDVAKPPSVMLIVHSLKFGYHDSGENRHREFHVALDSSDLAALKDVIARAEKKAATLKSQLEGAGVKPLEI